MAADATVYGSLDVEIPAISKLRTLREEGERTDQRIERLGRTLDRLGGPQATAGIRRVTSDVRDLGRQVDQTVPRVTGGFRRMAESVERDAGRMTAAVAGLREELSALGRDRATAEANVSGVAESIAEVQALRAELRGLDHDRATATVNVRESRSGGARTAAGAALPGLPGGGGGGGGGGFGRPPGGGGPPRGPVPPKARSFDEIPLGFTQVSPATIGAILPLVPQLVGGLGALTASAASATTGLAELGITAGGVAAVGLGSIAAVAVPAISSIGQVMKAQDALTTARQNTVQVGDQQRQQTEAVRQAEFGLISAQRQATTAQQDLTQARRDATRAITDLMFANRSARLEEERSQLGVLRARQNLQQVMLNPLSSQADIQEARLGLQGANLQRDTSHVQRRRAAADYLRARGRGVEGSRQVQDALFAVRSARVGLESARFGLDTAVRQLRRGAAGIFTAKQQLDLALRRAPPGIRQAVADIQRLRATFGAGVGLRGINPAISRAQTMVFGIVDRVTRGVRGIAGLVGRTAQISLGGASRGAGIFTRFLGSREFSRDSIALAHTFAQNAPGLTRAVINLATAGMRLSTALAPFLRSGTNALVRVTGSLATAAGHTDRIRSSFRGHLADLKAWWNLVKSFARLVYDLLRPGTRPGRGLVGDLTSQLNTWDTWARRNPAKLQSFFADAAKNTERIASAIGSIVSALWHLGRALSPLVGLAASVTQGLAPLLGSPAGSILALAGVRAGVGFYGGIKSQATNRLGRAGQAAGIGTRNVFRRIFGRTPIPRMPTPLGAPTGGGGFLSRWFEGARGSSARNPLFVWVVNGGVGGLPALGGGAGPTLPGTGGGGGGLTRSARLRQWLGHGATAEELRYAGGPEAEAALAAGATRFGRFGRVLGRVPGIGRGFSIADRVVGGGGRAAGLLSRLGGLGEAAGVLRFAGPALMGAARFLGPIGLGISALQGGMAFLSKQGTAGERLQSAGHALSFGIIHDSLTRAEKRTQGQDYATRFLQRATVDPRFGGAGGPRTAAQAAGLAARIQREIGRISGMGHLHAADRTRVDPMTGRTIHYQDQGNISQRDIAQVKTLNANYREAIRLQHQLHNQDEVRRATRYGNALGSVYDVFRARTHDTGVALKDTTGQMVRHLRNLHGQGRAILAQQSVDWLRQFGRTHKGMSDQAKAARDEVVGSLRDMGDKVVVAGGRVLVGTQQIWPQIRDSITSPITDARKAAGEGFDEIYREALGQLQQLGYSQADARKLVRAIVSGGRAGQVASSAIQTGSSTAADAVRLSGYTHARGGRLAGTGTRDNVPITRDIGAPGELVVNRHQERGANQLLSLFGTSLGDIVDRVTTPHYYAGGGRLSSQVSLAGVHAGVLRAADRIEQMFPGLTITSSTGGGHARDSYHYRGEALDIAGGYPLMNRAAAWIGAHMGRNLTEGIHNPNLSVAGGHRVPPSYWGSAVWGEHANHIHIAIAGALGALRGLGGAGGLIGPAQRIHLHPRLIQGGGVAGVMANTGQLLYAHGLQNRINASLLGGGDTGAGAGNYTGPLNRNFGRGSRVVLSPAQVQLLARRAGLPSWFWKIAKGESAFMPGAYSNDPNGYSHGRGLYQMTPEVWSPTQQARIGAMGNYFNPWTNTLMAKYLYEHAASKTPRTPGFPWYGTRYLAHGGRLGGGLFDNSTMPERGGLPFAGWFRDGGTMRVRRPMLVGVGDGQPAGGREELSIRRVRPGASGSHGYSVQVAVDMGGVTIKGGDEREAKALADKVADKVAVRLTEALSKHDTEN